jgi:hypothetical protein
MLTKRVDEWKQLPLHEWRRRLEAARSVALTRLAVHGLHVDVCEDSVAELVLERDGIGGQLRPALLDAARLVDEHVKRVGDPSMVIEDDESQLSERIYGYAMEIAEAAFLLGTITGCHVSWDVVAHMPPSYASPHEVRVAKRARGAR